MQGGGRGDGSRQRKVVGASTGREEFCSHVGSQLKEISSENVCVHVSGLDRVVCAHGNHSPFTDCF